MAVYKLFPTKTATIYSSYPDKNTGLDEITDLSLYNSNSLYTNPGESSRTLIQFDNDEIINLFHQYNIPSGSLLNSSFKAYLKLYLAKASEIPLEYSIYCAPISSSWNMGTGRLANLPETTDGVSWKWRDHLNGSEWQKVLNVAPDGIQNIPGVGILYSTSSLAPSVDYAAGGNWYYLFEDISNNFNFLYTTQSFNYSDSKDIELDISKQVNFWVHNIIPNDGTIIKYPDILEFNTSSINFETKYFTSNTHTIYPPCLEIKWDDFQYSTGSLSTINNNNVICTIGNNNGEYQQDSTPRFKINVRDKNPIRTFQTSSVYLNNKLLPSSSYWSIKDYDTEEIIIDYDVNYTKISANSEGNYFDIYCSGLQPERNYKILIKIILSSGEVIILDNNNIFKVIR